MNPLPPNTTLCFGIMHSKCSRYIGVASGMAGRALALPIMSPERDIAARATIEL